jgi:hypothetical protein
MSAAKQAASPLPPPPAPRGNAPPLYRERRNVVPLPYRRVSRQTIDAPLTEAGITAHLLGREAYRRTDFIVLQDRAGATAVAAVVKENNEPLFSPIAHVEVLALPDTCSYIHDADTDVANRSALAELAHRHGLGAEATVVVEGMYDHVNLIHHPDPLVLRVVEVSPPEPPKLYHLVQHVLSYADLPPIRLEFERIDVHALCVGISPKAYLLPCRSGGLDDLPAPVFFLDERPAKRQDWTLVGCERSLQFHRHYYGDEPPRVEMCPRKIVGECDRLTLVKCCLLEFNIEKIGNVAAVPWGTDLKMVEQALRELAGEAQVV